jgi:hypothetical protein
LTPPAGEWSTVSTNIPASQTAVLPQEEIPQ